MKRELPKRIEGLDVAFSPESTLTKKVNEIIDHLAHLQEREGELEDHDIINSGRLLGCKKCGAGDSEIKKGRACRGRKLVDDTPTATERGEKECDGNCSKRNGKEHLPFCKSVLPRSTPPHHEGWEKRFDLDFSSDEGGDQLFGKATSPREIKSFIRSLLYDYIPRKEVEEELADLATGGNCLKKKWDCCGYHDAISDAFSRFNLKDKN